MLAPWMRVFYSSDWYVMGHMVKQTDGKDPLGHQSIYRRNGHYSESYLKTNEKYYGNKLSSVISHITRVPEQYLTTPTSVYEASVAQRMRWASKRKTTRKEDLAYCLMGLFDVNMPLLYGEGRKAFLRLQEEILRRCHD